LFIINTGVFIFTLSGRITMVDLIMIHYIEYDVEYSGGKGKALAQCRTMFVTLHLLPYRGPFDMMRNMGIYGERGWIVLSY
jgi:hypothetical protein